MSTAAPFRARCPHCRRTFDTEVWRSLHIRRMPGARDELLSGRFGVHPCPSCGRPCLLEPVVLYTDFERGEWYALYPGWALGRAHSLAAQVEAGFRKNTIELAPRMVTEMTAGFQVRTCFGIPSLREKVLAHALGLDDRVLELWKLGILRGRHPRLPPGAALWLVGGDEIRLQFELVDPPGADEQIVVKDLSLPRAAYVEAASRYLGLAAEHFPRSVVDWRALLLPDGAKPPAAEEPPLSEGGKAG